MKKFYEIKYPVERLGVKKHWMRIGSATETEGEFGPVILATIEALPLNWNGEFALFESKKKPEEPK